jgi:hypothetical protein
MKEGSVTVFMGEQVGTGDVIGQVGLSGWTQFPNVHISVRRSGAVVDPFAPDGDRGCGAEAKNTLWNVPLDTPAGGLISVGFANDVPDYDRVKAGTAAANVLSADAPIILWAFAFGARTGDVVSITINGQDGAFFKTDDVLTREQALFMRAGGLNPPEDG